ncbi:MAG: protein jag [Clostridia bacterium]|nr:protein jag [Clostridia bacterium]
MKIYEGKTVSLAVENALKDLNVTENEIIFKIIDEGTKGILGIGGKKAKISVELKSEDGKRSVEFLDGLFDLLKVPAQAEFEEVDDKIIINIITTASSSLIGYRGEMLDALQTLAGAVANIGNDEYKRVVVDCENYRQKREETLKNLALRLSNKAITTERVVSLEPMNPFERRIIHATLCDVEGVKTESQGVEPNRFIVIIPDNAKPNKKDFSNKRGGRGGDKKRENRSSGFKSEMIKSTKKTSGFGTYLGNSLKNN